MGQGGDAARATDKKSVDQKTACSAPTQEFHTKGIVEA
jgi:hypothetical protein